ncbi:MAG: dynamin family protein [Egibacteraceae bacterium]
MAEEPVNPALATVDVALQAATAYQRPDLAARLQQTRRRLIDPAMRVLVVGEFKQGKSLLVNALVNAPICPVDDDISTAVPTAVRYSDTPVVTLVREGDEGDESPVVVSVPIEQLAEYVSEAGNPGNRRRLKCAEVGIPRQLLQAGLVLVDTPGVGGLGSVYGASTMAALPSADAVVLVSDAAQEYTAPELEFLRAAMRLCPNVVCVLTKTDFYPDWRRVAEHNARHLVQAGIEAELLPVSSTLRLHAVRTQDRALNAESGFPKLLDYLRDRVIAEAERLVRRSVAHDVLAVSEQLQATFRAELAAQTDPQRAAGLIAELERAKQRADELRQRSARWQQTLGDGIADLIADVDFDFRDRLRQVSRQADDAVEDDDPATAWEQTEAWLYQQTSAAASANYVWAAQRAKWLASQVAEHFEEGGTGLLPGIDVGGATTVLGRIAQAERPEMAGFGVGSKALTALRGSYGGMLMFGMLGSIAGMAVLNPVSVGAGLLLGGKSVRDERDRQLALRRSQAKSAIRRYLDDVGFQVGKDSRDTLRRIQRTLRDHFTAQAEEFHRSLSESLAAAQRAVQADQAERERRIRDLHAELNRLEALDRRAQALAPG